jgi:hypothetical protein
MSTLFDAPSPRGSNHAGLFLNAKGQLFDRHGRSWGRSQIMALDAALATTPESGEARTTRSTAEWAQSHAKAALYEALSEAAREHELDDQAHAALRDLIDQHLSGEAQEAKGMGAVDRDRGKGAIDDEIDAKVREYLKGHGLDDESVERAIALARKDREAAAKDRLPVNALEDGMGGYRSGVGKHDVSVDVDYPNNLIDMPDYSPDPDRFSSGYDPLKGRDPARNLPGGGVSRRLSNDAAMDDEELARLYPGIENVTVGI